VDVGNTSVRYGVVSGDEVSETDFLPTRDLLGSTQDFVRRLSTLGQVDGTAYCSVVPDADAGIESALGAFASSTFRLTHENCGDLPIRYPNPGEIGKDRLANALATRTFHGTPAVVVDIGTAATFDLVTTAGGYEGGVIAPGPQILADCLAGHTALLPTIEFPARPPLEAIGRTTREAMEIGVAHGFRGMIRGILEEVLASLVRIEPGRARLILTGGGAHATGDLDDLGGLHDPSLTLKGLAQASGMKGEA